MGRIMVIARKGAPPSQDDSDGSDSGDSSDSAPDGSQDVATCPNCGCKFDDESGDVVKPGAKVEGGPQSADYGKGDAMAKGPDLALPPTTPDKQAPAGDGALAALLGPLLAAGR